MVFVAEEGGVTDDYSCHPPTIGEIRSDKTLNASDWSPRDALIACLREIDSGRLTPEAIVICLSIPGSQPGASHTRFFASSPDAHKTLGILEAVKFYMFER